MFRHLVVFVLVIAFAWCALGAPPTVPSPDTQLNSSVPIQTEGGLNTTDNASTVGSRIYSVVKDLPTLKNIVIFICVFTAFLIICLVMRIYRSGRRMRKTRKYDIITTPAERVEMEPLNEENDDEEDSTLFDIKYR